MFALAKSFVNSSSSNGGRGMMKKIGETLQQQALGIAQCFQPRGRAGIVAAQVHQHGSGHLMAENGPQFLRAPKPGPLPAGLQQGGEALRLSLEDRFQRSQTRT